MSVKVTRIPTPEPGPGELRCRDCGRIKPEKDGDPCLECRRYQGHSGAPRRPTDRVRLRGRVFEEELGLRERRGAGSRRDWEKSSDD